MNYTVLQIEKGLFKVIGINTYPQLAYEILCEVHVLSSVITIAMLDS